MSGKKERIRSTNFTTDEELSLVHIISRYKDVLECKNTNKITARQREDAWEKVLTEFNSSNAERSLQQIKSKYDNLKTSARKYASSCNKNLCTTGGGPMVPPTTNKAKDIIYEVILNILNRKTVLGLSNLYDDDRDIIMDTINIENVTGSQNGNIVYLDVATSSDEINSERQSQDENRAEIENISPDPNTWETYTPSMLQQKKHKKLRVQNKPAPKIAEAKTLFH